MTKLRHVSTLNKKILALSNPDRMLYPEQGITKRQLANYYAAVQDWILPYIAKRPLTLVRCPQGFHKQCFYQKHFNEKIPAEIFIIPIKEKLKTDNYFYLKNIDGVISLVQLGVLEIHPWGSRVDNLEKPDMMIFDLDPAPDVAWKKVLEAAFHLREQLENLNLISFVKTTGGKGLHVVVPIKRRYPWDDVKDFSHAVVEYLVKLSPNNFTANMSKLKRQSKIFIDYLRNGRGATAIAPYSTRARPGCPVATPLAWEELHAKLNPQGLNIETVAQRLRTLKHDPWAKFYATAQHLPDLEKVKK